MQPTVCISLQLGLGVNPFRKRFVNTPEAKLPITALQSLNTLEVKDSDLESSLVALEGALKDLEALPDVEAEKAAALAAREALQQRVAAQMKLEETMASVRGISKEEGM